MIPARVCGALLLLAFYLLSFPGKLAGIETIDDLRQRGIQAMRAHDFAAARQTFLQLVDREPSAENYDFLATAEAAAGQAEPAIAHFQKSIQLGNRTAIVHYSLGILEMQVHHVDAAKAAFQKAVDLDPHYLPARYGLGVALLGSGHPQQAAAVMEKTLEQTPHEARFWALLVSAQFAAGDSPKAIASTQKAGQDFPDEPRLDVTLATICLRYQAVQRARELLEDANELMPKDSEVALLLAKASLMAGEPVEALAVLQGMEPADQKNTKRMIMMGQAKALLGDLNSAADDLQMALKDSPQDPECLAAYAWLQDLQGHFEDSISTLTKARSVLPRAPWVPYRMAVSYYFLGKYEQTEIACQETLQLDPKYAPAYLLRGIAKLNEKQYEAARIDIAKAVDLAPDNPLFHRQLGVALYEGGKTVLAIEQFDFALRRNPKDAEGYFWRAKSLKAQGEREKAIADLSMAIELKPGYADVYTELAQLYTETGRPSRAAEVLAQQKQAGATSQPSGDDTLLHALPDATR
jgi:tetratricopeptide (TPR) repeat protein